MSFAVSILITILVLALVCGILYLVWKRRKGREGKKNQSKIRRKAMVSNCTFSSSQLSYGEVDSDLGFTSHRRFRGIESRVLKICDFKKVIFSPFFKHNITGFGVLIPKRYHMLG